MSSESSSSAADEARAAMDRARISVMESENEIQKIKSALRSVGGGEASAASPNSLTVTALKVSGLPESAKPSFKLQLSSPVEELTLTGLYDPLDADADADGRTAKFDGVDAAVATLTVSAFDADVPLGSSAAHDLAPLCDFDPLAPGGSKKETRIDVAIVPEDGGGGSAAEVAAAAAAPEAAKAEDEETKADEGEAKGEVAEETTTTASTPRPAVFCGPSGVGKGTLIELLMKKYPDSFGFSVSHTTRPPREGEKDGVHYNFTTVDDIKRDIDDGKFIEHAEVHGKYYGTSVAAVETVRESGKICVLDIDVQGVRSVKGSALEPIYVFIAPPSMEALEERLRGRGTESEEDVKKRLANAQGEMDYGMVEGNFDRVFTNDDLDKTFAALAEAFEGWYPHLAKKSGGEPAKEEEPKEPEAAKEGGAAVQIPVCTVTLKAEYRPSATDRRDKLYDLLNEASKRKAAAIDRLRKSAAEVSRVTKPTAAPAGGDKGGDKAAVKSGFLNKKGKKKGSEPGFLTRWYQRTIGPESLARRIYPVVHNYVLFFAAVALMHFQGHNLALPPPV